MRGGGEEQAVLEAAGQIAHRPGEAGLDAVAAAACGSGVMRLVQDQQADCLQLAQPLAHGVGVGGVRQQVGEIRKRLWVRQGLTPKPRSRCTRAT